jgi:hypothetical protein
MTAIDPSNFSRNRRAMITLRPEIDSFAGDLSLHTCFERTIEQEPGTAKARFNPLCSRLTSPTLTSI